MQLFKINFMMLFLIPKIIMGLREILKFSIYLIK